MDVQAPPRPVAVIGAGLDLGAGRRGVDMGPSAIRYAGLARGCVQLRLLVGGQRDQADRRVVAAEPGRRGDAVDERHVQVEDAGLRLQLVRELDRRQAVGDRADDMELRLAVDQDAQRLEVGGVVVGEHDANRPVPARDPPVRHLPQR